MRYNGISRKLSGPVTCCSHLSPIDGAFGVYAQFSHRLVVLGDVQGHKDDELGLLG